MNKNEIADRIEEAMASLPDDLKAVGKLNELIADLRGEVSAMGTSPGGGNGNGPPTGP